MSLARGFHFLDFTSGDLTFIADPEPDRTNNRINDGKVDKRGRFVAGTMDTMEEGPNGALYRLDPDSRHTRSTTGSSSPNGPCWSPDDKIFYFADSWSGEIWAYDYDIATGNVANRARLRQARHLDGGAADGSTVDAEGCLWNAQVYDGKLIRYTPDGKIERVIEMPVKKVTSVMFGGPKLDVLYVTSMAKPPLPRFPGDGVLRGSLFAINGLGIKGCRSRASADEAARPPASGPRRQQAGEAVELGNAQRLRAAVGRDAGLPQQRFTPSGFSDPRSILRRCPNAAAVSRSIRANMSGPAARCGTSTTPLRTTPSVAA